VKKYLIIRFSSIGDIVLTTPVIRCLKEHDPGCEIHYLTKKQYHPILRENPYISKVHLFENSFREVIRELKSENFDFIIDLHKNFRSSYILLKLRRPFGTFSKLNIRKWIRINLRINLLPDIHIADRYFRALPLQKPIISSRVSQASSTLIVSYGFSAPP
jgi:ADP-heptose:LPS heptosyltransferase